MAARIKPAGQSQVERDAISLGRIESLIDGVLGAGITCPRCQEEHKIKTLDNSVIQAMKIRYDKLRPSLSAVEQTIVNDDEKLDDNQLLTMLSELIDKHPDLVQQAIAAKARRAGVAEVPNAATQHVSVVQKTGNHV